MFSSLRHTNCCLLRHYFFQESKPSLRNISSLEKKSSKPAVIDRSQFKLIYDFPYIKYITAVLRSNKRVPAFAVAIAPFLYFLDSTKVSPFITVFTGGIYYLLGIPLSKITNNTVGKMYVNKEGDIRDVMISSVDKSGRRIDRIHSFNDVINTDFSSTAARYLGFVSLIVQNSDVRYKLNIYSCKYVDEKVCDYLLGWSPLHPNEVKRNETEISKRELQD